MEESNNDYRLPEGIRDPSLEFELLESLGKGSFGAVHKARYRRTGNIYAIKLVPVNEDFQEILKEINIMKQCKSKYIVQYFGNYFKDETCWIIMEYCALGSISDMMNLTDNILNEEQIALVCYSTLQGLYYLHKNSKIHRDIKPGNILVTASGECKLADFGVSGQLSERTRKRNTVIGTPFFLAPEVIQEEGYDSKADIWALGISAIEMAQFHPPYHDLHPMRVLFMIPTSPSPTLKDTDKWSTEFADFLKLCLYKEQGKRGSAKDLLKHPFFEKKLKGTFVMKSLADTAQRIIDGHGGRENAIKYSADRRAKRSGDAAFKQADRVDNPDDSDEEDLLEKNNNKLAQQNQPQPQSPPSIHHQQQQPQYQQQQQYQQQPQQSPPSTNKSSLRNDVSLNQLDSLLNGIMISNGNGNGNSNSNGNGNSNSNGNGSNNRSSSSLNLNNNNNNVSNKTSSSTPVTSSPSFLHNNNSSNNNNNNINGYNSNNSNYNGNQFSLNNNNATNANQTSSPIQSSMNFNRQLSNNSIPTSPNTVPSKPIEQKPKASSSELDDLLEEMLNPSFGSKPRGLTPISSPIPKRLSTNGANTPPPQQILKALGSWRKDNAGGCANTSSWRKNPQYLLQLSGSSSTTVKLVLRQTGDKLVHIGFYFAKANFNQQDVQKKRITLTTEFLVPGLDITFLRNSEVTAKATIDPGNYVIIPATFEPGLEGTFELEVTPSESSLRLTEITPDRDWCSITDQYEWKGDSAGGSFSGSSATWKDNPKFFFDVPSQRQTNVTIVLSKSIDMPKETYIGFYVFKTNSNNSNGEYSCPYIYLTAANLVTKTNFLNGHEVLHSHTFQPGSYVIVPCTYDARQEGKFTVTCYADQVIQKIDQNDKVITIRDEWRAISAGGCLNHTTWRNNPQYLISNNSNQTSRVTVILEQLESLDNQALPFVGFYVARAPLANLSKKLYTLTPKDIVGNTEFINDYQVHFTTTLDPESAVVIIPSSFTPNIEQSFNLRVVSSQYQTEVKKLPEWYQKKVIGDWSGSSCGGRYSNTSSSWTLNPRFQFNLSRSSGGRYTVILTQSDKQPFHGIGFYYFKTLPDGTMKELIAKSGFVCGKEIVVEGISNESVQGVILPATFEPGVPDTFSLTIYSENEYEFRK